MRCRSRFVMKDTTKEPSARYRFGQGSVAGTRGNEQEAP